MHFKLEDWCAYLSYHKTQSANTRKPTGSERMKKIWIHIALTMNSLGLRVGYRPASCLHTGTRWRVSKLHCSGMFPKSWKALNVVARWMVCTEALWLCEKRSDSEVSWPLVTSAHGADNQGSSKATCGFWSVCTWCFHGRKLQGYAGSKVWGSIILLPVESPLWSCLVCLWKAGSSTCKAANKDVLEKGCITDGVGEVCCNHASWCVNCLA